MKGLFYSLNSFGTIEFWLIVCNEHERGVSFWNDKLLNSDFPGKHMGLSCHLLNKLNKCVEKIYGNLAVEDCIICEGDRCSSLEVNDEEYCHLKQAVSRLRI